MTRVEAIREREFKRPVQFAVVGRDALATRGADPPERRRSSLYHDGIYEATFIINESTDAYGEVVGERAASVGGFYVPGSDRFFLVTDDPRRPVINEGVLVHELIHALQDQTGLLDSATAASADGRRARLGLVEGDANYVQARYRSRCQNGTWDCVPTPATDERRPEFNLGVYLVGYQPYSDGPALVADLRRRGGWTGVDAAYDTVPVSSEQTIHPERYPNERPTPIAYRPDLTGEWRQFANETVGEAWLFAMFWYQGRAYDISVTDGRRILEPDAGAFDTYNYTSVPSEEWANDRLFLLTDGSAGGHVWVTDWDSAADARQFRDAYVRTVEGHGGTAVGPTTWRIPEGNGYADAFRVVRDGTRVVVVNGPTEKSLTAIAPDVPDDNTTGRPRAGAEPGR